MVLAIDEHRANPEVAHHLVIEADDRFVRNVVLQGRIDNGGRDWRSRVVRIVARRAVQQVQRLAVSLEYLQFARLDDLVAVQVLPRESERGRGTSRLERAGRE